MAPASQVSLSLPGEGGEVGMTVNPLLQMRKLRLADCQSTLWLRIS